MRTGDVSCEADALVRKGVRLAAADQRPEAVACLDRAATLAPDHPVAQLHLSLSLAAEGRFGEAREHLRPALALRPESAPFHLFAGRVLLDAADHAAASAEFARALELSPENELVRSYTLLNEWAAGRPEAAERFDPENLTDSNPFLARLLMLVELELKGRTVDFVDEERVPAFFNRLQIGYHLWRSALEQKGGRFLEAARRLQMVMEMQPGHPGALAQYKECRQAVLAAARRTVEERPNSGAEQLALAELLADEEQYVESEAELAEAKRLFSEQGRENKLERPETLRFRGRLAWGLGRFEEALKLHSDGAEPGFSMGETHYYLGLCHLGLGDHRSCVKEFEALVLMMWYTVPLRFREYLEYRRSGAETEPVPATAPEVQT